MQHRGTSRSDYGRVWLAPHPKGLSDFYRVPLEPIWAGLTSLVEACSGRVPYRKSIMERGMTMGTIASAVKGSRPLKEEIEVVGCDEADGDCIESGIDPDALRQSLPSDACNGYEADHGCHRGAGAQLGLLAHSPGHCRLGAVSSPGPIIFRQEAQRVPKGFFNSLSSGR